jgi:RNA polymerase sigma factor (sigma-70 family)
VTASRYQKMDDPKLVSLCLSGDSEAWEALIMRYRRLIFSIPVKFGFSPADCSDVFQTVCVKLIEHLGSLKDESKVSAWLITTTTRHCIQAKSLKYRDISDEEEIEATPDRGETMEHIRIQSDQQQKVREAIEGLAERCRRLLQLLYFERASPSYEEIGKSMDMPVASIGPTRARCLDKLRTVLRRKGIR